MKIRRHFILKRLMQRNTMYSITYDIKHVAQHIAITLNRLPFTGHFVNKEKNMEARKSVKIKTCLKVNNKSCPLN